MTIGSDEGTANALKELGANHKVTGHGEVIHDKKNNVFTTPCYMLDATILDIADGAENIVKAMIQALS
jgi:enhancing lycopene biosynthesis protein 2